MTTSRASASAELAAVTPRCTGVQRVELQSADLARARDFYVDALGFPLLLEARAMFVVLVGETPVAVHGHADEHTGEPTGEQVGAGLERLVVGCDGDVELERVGAALATRGVATSGLC